MDIQKMTATHDNRKQHFYDEGYGWWKDCYCDCCNKPITLGDQFFTDGHIVHCADCGLYDWEIYHDRYYELYSKCTAPERKYPFSTEGLDEFSSNVSSVFDLLEGMRSNLEARYSELEEKYGDRFTDFYEELEENIEHANYSLEIIEAADIDEDYADSKLIEAVYREADFEQTFA